MWTFCLATVLILVNQVLTKDDADWHQRMQIQKSDFAKFLKYEKLLDYLNGDEIQTRRTFPLSFGLGILTERFKNNLLKHSYETELEKMTSHDLKSLVLRKPSRLRFEGSFELEKQNYLMKQKLLEQENTIAMLKKGKGTGESNSGLEDRPRGTANVKLNAESGGNGNKKGKVGDAGDNGQNEDGNRRGKGKGEPEQSDTRPIIINQYGGTIMQSKGEVTAVNKDVPTDNNDSNRYGSEGPSPGLTQVELEQIAAREEQNWERFRTGSESDSSTRMNSPRPDQSLLSGNSLLSNSNSNSKLNGGTNAKANVWD